MKNKKYWIIALVVLILIATLFIINNNKSTLSSKTTAFSINDTATITKIYLSDKFNNNVLLERKQNHLWLVNNKYEVHNEQINTLLGTIKNIEIRGPLSNKSHNNVLLLLSAKSVKTEIYQQKYRINLFGLKLFPHDKMTKCYYIGDPTMDNIGTYALLHGSKKPVVVYLPNFRGFIASRYSTSESSWRRHEICKIKLPEIKTITLEFLKQPEQSFKVINNNSETLSLIQLINNKNIESFDTLSLIQLATSFQNLNYDNIIPDSKKTLRDSITKNLPTHILTVEAIDGKKYILKTFTRKLDKPEIDELTGALIDYDRDGMYALINDDKDFVTIQLFVFDLILKPLAYYLE